MKYGIVTFGDLFTDRQLTVLGTLSDLIKDVQAEIQNDALRAGFGDDPTPLCDGGKGAFAYAQAICVYLQLALDRCTDFSNTAASWNPHNEKVMHLFSKQAIPMTWDFGEVNILGDVVGGFAPASAFISECVKQIIPESAGMIHSHDAQTVKYPEGAVVSTDPPYYNNIRYAELSDFFFEWQRRTLKSVYPALFGVLETPKRDELVATPYRFGGVQKADEFFHNGMRETLRNICDQANPEVPVTIYYAFKQSEVKKEGTSSKGWATFLQAVLDAGYSVVRTWPIRSEQPHRMVAAGTNALASSVVLVCRPVSSAAEIATRSEFVRSLKRKLPREISQLQAVSIRPSDMPQSALGPGMGIFSSYKCVLESDDSPMSVRTALELINREVEEYRGGIQGQFDAITRFAITLFEQNGIEKCDYGTADNISRPLGISVDDASASGLIEAKAGKVRILNWDEVDMQRKPSDDDRTVWMSLQRLINLHQNEGLSSNTVSFFKLLEDQVDEVKDLAYGLYEVAATKRNEASTAVAYNALVADWTELVHLASAVSADDAAEQLYLEV